jgi:hypothetical protein
MLEGRFDRTAPGTIECRTILPYAAMVVVLFFFVAAVGLSIKALSLPPPYPFAAPVLLLVLGYLLVPVLWYRREETWLLEQVRLTVAASA